jgi:phosphotransferase system HPr (HPr) family protein
MREITLTARKKVGLHARPAALFVHPPRGFMSMTKVSKDNRGVDARSILGVLTLYVRAGAAMTVRAGGEDEGPAIEALHKLVESNFVETHAEV